MTDQPPCLDDPPAVAKRVLAADAMLGLYAETFRRDVRSHFASDSLELIDRMLAGVTERDIKDMLLAAIVRLADAENAKEQDR